MIIVWRGWGILCVLIPSGLIVLAETVAGERVFQRYTNAIWARVLLVSAAILWVLGTRLNGGPGRTLVDPATRQRVVLRKTHSFFFIRLEYWAVIFAVFAVVALLVTVVSAFVH